jgi:hypothetical protein
VENTLETAVNRTVDISNQTLADSGGDLSIPLFAVGFIVGLDLGLNKVDPSENNELTPIVH